MKEKTNFQEESQAAKIALKFVNSTHRHIFLTGKAGTGKTTFLKKIVSLTHKATVVAAPTGIAAINAEGVTLHSLFQLPFGMFVPNNTLPNNKNINFQLNTPHSLLRNLRMHSTKRNLLRKLELLIIDEASMLRADLLDAVDAVLRHVRRRRQEPFGGVQVLFIGDLLQLPPVVKDQEQPILTQYYSSPFFFEAHVLKEDPPLYIELEKIYRQSDYEFIKLLGNLRENKVTSEDIQVLNKHYHPNLETKELQGYIHLTTHNRLADRINKEELEKLSQKKYQYAAGVTGDFSEHLFPVDPVLTLKCGAQVMFIKNDISGEKRFFNGKIGTVIALKEDSIKVGFNDDSQDVVVDKYTWENKRYRLDHTTSEISEKVIGKFEQYPLKLAWAITVHKSQGLTFEKAIIDVSKAFAPGQVYVALSRLTSLKGLILTGTIKQNGLTQDPQLFKFAESKKTIPALEHAFKTDAMQFLTLFTKQAFQFEYIIDQFNYHIYKTSKGKVNTVKQQHLPTVKVMHRDFFPAKEVADKFLGQIEKITSSNQTDAIPYLLQRVTAAQNYFDPIFADFSQQILSLIQEVKKEKRVKAYINELKDLELVFTSQKLKIEKAKKMLNATINDADITREALGLSDKANSGEKEGQQKLKAASPKNGQKIDTKKMSYDMYCQGKNIAEIALERRLTTGTIERHLCHYIKSGKLKATQLVDQDKINTIKKVIVALDTQHLSPIKAKLGSQYSYTDIHFAMADYAYHQSLEKEKGSIEN